MERRIRAATDDAARWPSQRTRVIEVFDLLLSRAFQTPLPTRCIRIYRGTIPADLRDRIREYAERDLLLLADNPSCSFIAIGVGESDQGIAISLWSDREGIEMFERMKADEAERWQWLRAPAEPLHYEMLTPMGPE